MDHGLSWAKYWGMNLMIVVSYIQLHFSITHSLKDRFLILKDLWNKSYNLIKFGPLYSFQKANEYVYRYIHFLCLKKVYNLHEKIYLETSND